MSNQQIYNDEQKAMRAKQLQSVIDRVNKTYGQGTVMSLNSKPQIIDVISSGSLSLDIALGVGGFPRGRIIEIYGPESSGKTTVAIHAIAECQKRGGVAAFIDAEHAFDRYYAESLGVNTEKLQFCQPDNGEQALEVTDDLIRSNSVDMIVIDSVAALVPKAEIEGEMGDSKMGLHARLMSQAMRKLTSAISKSNCICIFINQLRDKIGVTFVNPEVTTGGNALKFYSTIRLDIRRNSQTNKDRNNDDVGSHIRVKVIKNKVAPPFKIAEFDIDFGFGINREGEVLELGCKYDVIDKSGAWYAYEGSKIAQGKEAGIQFLRDNPELCEEIIDKIHKVVY